MNDEAPQRIREELTLRKFGGAEPKACRPEDLLEEITLVIEDGEVVFREITAGPAKVLTTDEVRELKRALEA